ncbi:hypothetical protein [Amycolatopsis pithecellobii]|uniref:hypothetical protein n=1 Tax=Amycolatopsis pithecellobii TaxID=664692 RepID=UPI001AA016CB|nr:hypothetical protein [Amycolatopsis pithecellobii]
MTPPPLEPDPIGSVYEQLADHLAQRITSVTVRSKGTYVAATENHGVGDRKST